MYASIGLGISGLIARESSVLYERVATPREVLTSLSVVAYFIRVTMPDCRRRASREILMRGLTSDERVLECAGLRNTISPIAYDVIDDL